MANKLILISFLLYLFFGLVHSIIIAPTGRFKKNRTGSPFTTPDDLIDMYYANKPGILRKVKLLDLCVQFNFVFYVASVLFLIIAVWYKSSIFRIGLVIGASIFLFVILEAVMTAIGFLLDNEKMKK
jgi:hypothetical protein